MSTTGLPAANTVLANEITALRERFTVDYLGVEAGVHGILIKDFPVPSDAYRVEGAPAEAPQRVDLLLRISEAYPNGTPDMFWVVPPIRLTQGGMPAAGEVMETYFGRLWQRFSWHLTNAQWRPVADTLSGTFVPFIEHRLAQRR